MCTSALHSKQQSDTCEACFASHLTFADRSAPLEAPPQSLVHILCITYRSMQGLLQRVAQLSLQRTRLSGDAGVATCQSLLSLLLHSAAADQHAAAATAAGSERSVSAARLIVPEDCGCSSPAATSGRGSEAGRHAASAGRPSGVSTPAAGIPDLRPAAAYQLAGVSQQSCSVHSSAHVRAPAAGNAGEAAGVQPPAPEAAVQQAPPPPWTPTKDLAKRKTLPKRMGHMLQVLLLLP